MKTNKNKNRLEIRLDPESLELLNSLIARTSLTKTSLIKTALKVYASSLKNGHLFTVRLKATEDSCEKKSHNVEIKQDEEKENYDIDEEMKKLNEDYPYKY